MSAMNRCAKLIAGSGARYTTALTSLREARDAIGTMGMCASDMAAIPDVGVTTEADSTERIATGVGGTGELI